MTDAERRSYEERIANLSRDREAAIRRAKTLRAQLDEANATVLRQTDEIERLRAKLRAVDEGMGKIGRLLRRALRGL